MVEFGDFIKDLKSTFNGSCGGPGGLTGEHFKCIIEVPGVVEALFRVFKLLIDGAFPAWSHPYICNQNLLALGEKERPVCIGGWLMRTASKLCDRTVDASESQEFFLHTGDGYKVLQFGTSIRGGAEAAHMLVDLRVHEEGARRVAIQKDGANAYNVTDREYAVEQCAMVFPSTARWARWLYGTPSLLRTGDDFIWATNGVYQGDALGGRIHDTALHFALMKAAKETATAYDLENADDELVIVAYRDDVHITGTTEVAIHNNTQVDKFREELTGVTESKHKTRAYAPRRTFNSDDNLHTHAVLPLQGTYIPHDRISTQGLKTIGAPIGTDEFISEQVHKQCKKYPKFIPRLYKMDPECAIFILRDCHLPIATHLIRMLHPTHTIEHAHELDGDIFAAYQHLADDFDIKITDPMYFQPFRHSGLGFRSIPISPVSTPTPNYKFFIRLIIF